MNPNKLTPVLFALPLLFSTLGCPSRTDDADDTPATGGRATRQHDAGSDAGAAGSAGQGGVAGAGGAAWAIATCSPTCNSATQACVSGACLLSDGQSCTVRAQCASGACTPFYVDEDGDGYGTGQALGFCGTTTPIGYAVQNGDCCDDGTHLAIARLIHPGAGYQTTSAGGVCNITWDYDCSGGVEVSLGALTGGCTNTDCSPIYTPYPASDCGLQESVADCALGGPGGPNACYTVGSMMTVGCK
jgi:hypothetical protein